MNKVLVIGSLNYDSTFYVDNLPNEGETISSTDYKFSIGGKGANQAATLAKLALEVSMVGKIGKDSQGSQIKKELSDLGVNVDSILSCDNITGQAFITVKKGGTNTIIIAGGANNDLSEGDIYACRSQIDESSAVLLQLEIPLNTVNTALSLSKERNKLTVLNPAPAVKLDKDILSKVDILIPNETELGVLVGKSIKTEAEIKSACKFLVSQGVKIVIVTLGSNGCALYSDNKLTMFSAHEATVVDTTAAGDSFIGGFLFSYLNDKVLEKAIDFGQKVSAITVSREGALQAIPTIKEIINS